jgi:DNA helicase HerA-like ATPase
MPSYALDPPIAKSAGDVVAGDPSSRGKDKLLLGNLTEAGPRRQLWLDITGEQVVAILGKRGTGKSYTLGVIAEGLAAGHGQTPISPATADCSLGWAIEFPHPKSWGNSAGNC